MVGIEIGHDVGSLRHVNRHIHTETIKSGVLDNNLSSIAKVLEFHQVVQLVVGGQWRVAQDIAQIGGAQDIETTTHGQVLQGSAHACEDVNEGLAIGNTLCMLFGTNNLVVLSPHAHIDRYTLQVCKVDVALNIERTVVVLRIDNEILKQQLTVLDAHGVIVETQLHTVGDALQIGRGKVELAINLWLRQRTLHRQFSFAKALQAEQLVGHKTVGQRQGKMLQ